MPWFVPVFLIAIFAFLSMELFDSIVFNLSSEVCIRSLVLSLLKLRLGQHSGPLGHDTHSEAETLPGAMASKQNTPTSLNLNQPPLVPLGIPGWVPGRMPTPTVKDGPFCLYPGPWSGVCWLMTSVPRRHHESGQIPAEAPRPGNHNNSQ